MSQLTEVVLKDRNSLVSESVLANDVPQVINTFEPIYVSSGIKINEMATDMMFRGILNKMKDGFYHFYRNGMNVEVREPQSSSIDTIEHITMAEVDRFTPFKTKCDRVLLNGVTYEAKFLSYEQIKAKVDFVLFLGKVYIKC